jgi:hypothetical protein
MLRNLLNIVKDLQISDLMYPEEECDTYVAGAGELMAYYKHLYLPPLGDRYSVWGPDRVVLAVE